MIDIRTANEAVYDTLKQIAPPETRYVLVLWDESNRACIASNELNENIVHRMLLGAAEVVATAAPHDFIRIDEPAGHA